MYKYIKYYFIKICTGKVTFTIGSTNGAYLKVTQSWIIVINWYFLYNKLLLLNPKRLNSQFDFDKSKTPASQPRDIRTLCGQYDSWRGYNFSIRYAKLEVLYCPFKSYNGTFCKR